MSRAAIESFRSFRARGVAGALVLAVLLAEHDARADESVPVPRFHVVAMRGAGTVAQLRKDLGAVRFLDVLRVNRVDAESAARLDSLWIPSAAVPPEELAPFPPRFERADSVPRLLVVSPRIQAFAAFERGRLVRWGPASTGVATSPTPRGWYTANWKSPLHVSSADSTWILPWCVNFDHKIGMDVHAYSLPGRPASHCCIRLLDVDARWVFDWVDTATVSPETGLPATGTPLLVMDAFDWDSPAPWTRGPDSALVEVGAMDAAWDELAPGANGSQDARDEAMGPWRD